MSGRGNSQQNYCLYLKTTIVVYNRILIQILIRSINDGYAVVEFTDENEVDVVPVRWLANKDTMCQWPTYRMTAKITKAVKANIAPNAEFRPLPVRVLPKTG